MYKKWMSEEIMSEEMIVSDEGMDKIVTMFW